VACFSFWHSRWVTRIRASNAGGWDCRSHGCSERVRRLRHPRVHVDTPKRRAVHFVSNVELERASEANVNGLALSMLLVAEYRTGDVQRLFAGR